MTAKQIEDAVRTYTVLATEDAKACGCDRASVHLDCDTLLRGGGLRWTAHIYGWAGSDIPVSMGPEPGETPATALAKAHETFLEAVDARVAEQAEEVTE